MAIAFDSPVSTEDLTAFARRVPVDQTYVLNTILPDRVDDVLEAEFAEVIYTARAAKVRAWDAPPVSGRRDRFMTSKVKLPAVSQMLGQGERDTLDLERYRTGGTATAPIVRSLYNDTQNNVEAVLRRAEIMRGDLLTDGIVTLPELGDMDADFGVPAEHKNVAPAVLWTNHANADILTDLRTWGRTYRNNNGFGFGGMIVSEDTLYDMLQNEAIRDLYSNLGGAPSVVTTDQLNQALVANRCPPIRLVYDAQYIDDNDQAQRILPPDRVIFTPPEGIELGYTQWGMTATGLKLQGKGVTIEPSPAGIVAVTDESEAPPYRRESYVDATVMPVLSRPRALFSADVA